MGRRGIWVYLLSWSIGSVALGIDCKKYPPIAGRNPNPLPRGTGQIVGGIVMVSVALPVSLIAGLAVGIVNGCQDAETDSNCHEQNLNAEKKGWMTTGTVLLAGVAGGTLLIMDGHDERTTHNQWNSECKKGERSRDPESSTAYEGIQFKGFSLERAASGFPAIGANFSI